MHTFKKSLEIANKIVHDTASEFGLSEEDRKSACEAGLLIRVHWTGTPISKQIVLLEYLIEVLRKVEEAKL